MQYYVDLFWQRQDFTGKLADLPTVHRAKQRFQTIADFTFTNISHRASINLSF